MTAFAAMLEREVRIMCREPVVTFLRTLIQPILYLLVFVCILPRASSVAAPREFATTIGAGHAGWPLMFQSFTAVMFPLVGELFVQGSIQDRVLAPISVRGLGVQKIVAGAVQGMVATLLLLPLLMLICPGIGVRSSLALALAAVAVLGSVACAALALLVMTLVQHKHVQLVFAVFLLPLTAFGCVYFSWPSLHSLRWLQIAVLADPLVYISEGIRACLAPELPHLPLAVSLSVLAALAVGLTQVATRSFERRVLG
jgi:ABC-2 type transport system permease protein